MIDKKNVRRIMKPTDALTLDPRHTSTTNHFGSIMSTSTQGIRSTCRAGSTSRAQNNSRILIQSVVEHRVRHASVIPYNKSRFSKNKP
mmetsp:Transcript_11549/g.13763  ORF Transcript_11549/g.13763 Transcript_11549/m.13763 type:complete len:88 (-) Transcript_11549:34-297(-)